MTHCACSGCDQPRKGFGQYCHGHAQRDRRNGHPHQEAITKTILAPYLRMVRKKVEENAGRDAWRLTEARLRGVLDECRVIVSKRHEGVAGIVWEYEAAVEMLAVMDAASFDDVLETACAMWLLANDRPRLFRSDRAFSVQLARRVRSLAPMSRGQSYNHKTGKVDLIYRDAKPRTQLHIAHHLDAVFGPLGLHLAQLMLGERQAVEDERRRWLGSIGEVV